MAKLQYKSNQKERQPEVEKLLVVLQQLNMSPGMLPSQNIETLLNRYKKNAMVNSNKAENFLSAFEWFSVGGVWENLVKVKIYNWLP